MVGEDGTRCRHGAREQRLEYHALSMLRAHSYTPINGATHRIGPVVLRVADDTDQRWTGKGWAVEGGPTSKATGYPRVAAWKRGRHTVAGTPG